MAAALVPAVARQAPTVADVPCRAIPVPVAGSRLDGVAKSVNFAIEGGCIKVCSEGGQTVAEGRSKALPRIDR